MQWTAQAWQPGFAKKFLVNFFFFFLFFLNKYFTKECFITNQIVTKQSYKKILWQNFLIKQKQNKKASQDIKTLPRVHIIGLFLPKNSLKFFCFILIARFWFFFGFVPLSSFEFYQISSFLVLFKFVEFEVLSQYQLGVNIWVLLLFQFLSLVLSQFEFLSFTTVWVSFSQFVFWSFITTWVFKFSHNFGLVPIWVFEW